MGYMPHLRRDVHARHARKCARNTRMRMSHIPRDDRIAATTPHAHTHTHTPSAQRVDTTASVRARLLLQGPPLLDPAFCREGPPGHAHVRQADPIWARRRPPRAYVGPDAPSQPDAHAAPARMAPSSAACLALAALALLACGAPCACWGASPAAGQRTRPSQGRGEARGGSRRPHAHPHECNTDSKHLEYVCRQHAIKCSPTVIE